MKKSSPYKDHSHSGTSVTSSSVISCSAPAAWACLRVFAHVIPPYTWNVLPQTTWLTLHYLPVFAPLSLSRRPSLIYLFIYLFKMTIHPTLVSPCAFFVHLLPSECCTCELLIHFMSFLQTPQNVSSTWAGIFICFAHCCIPGAYNSA